MPKPIKVSKNNVIKVNKIDQKNINNDSSAVHELKIKEYTFENRNFLKLFTDNHNNIFVSIFDSNNCMLKSSVNIIKLIGQENFNKIILALNTVLNENVRFAAIESLLEVRCNPIIVKEKSLEAAKFKLPMSSENSKQKVLYKLPNKMKIVNLGEIIGENTKIKALLHRKLEMKDNFTQTDMLTPESYFKVPKKRRRTTVTTCVVKKVERENFTNLFYKKEDNIFSNNVVKRTVIDPEEFKKDMYKNSSVNDLASELNDESSRMSLGAHSISTVGTDNIEDKAWLILNITEKHTANEDLTITTKENTHEGAPQLLDSLTTPAEKCRLLYQQAHSDWRNCLIPNEYDRLPIHEAAIKDDEDLLRKQCIILKAKGESVDIGDASKNISALQYAIQTRSSPSIVSTLLKYGADVLEVDDDNSTAFHYAAREIDIYCTVLIKHCYDNICSILTEYNLWKDKSESNPEILMEWLFTYMCTIFDNDGYNCLMIASKLGNYSIVKALLKLSSVNINIAMPNSGNTALYLAVEHSVLKDTSNQNIPRSFMQTINSLIENGADPGLSNLSGHTVIGLIHELKCLPLTKLLLKYEHNENTSNIFFNNDQTYQQTIITANAKNKSNIHILDNVQVTGNCIINSLNPN